MKRTMKRPLRLPNGTRVHIQSAHFAEECDGVVTKGEYDGGWLYRIKVIDGQAPEVCRNQDGEVWVWDFEVTPIT